MKRPTIMLMEQDTSLHGTLKDLLLQQEFSVFEAINSTTLLEQLRHNGADLIILESQNDATTELELARQIRHFYHTLPLILIVRDSSEDVVIAALRTGISDYFKPPFTCQELLASIRCWLSMCRLEQHPVRRDGTVICQRNSGGEIVSNSPIMQEIKAQLLRAAAVESNVLITGETGTGKELAAEFIHSHSFRSHKPMVSINCAAVPSSLLESELFGHEKGAFTGAITLRKGIFELAHESTLFLDEIGDMSLEAQAKILRAIERKEVQRLGGKTSIPLNLRIIAATHQNLERLIEEKKFREDLYFRLNVITIHLPPLRDRKEDILALLSYCLAELNQRMDRGMESFSEEVLECLLRYPWPGNVRELKNLVEATSVMLPPGKITLKDLPEQFRKRLGCIETLPLSERERLLSTLFSVSWNKSKAAQKLSWSRMTLYRKMAKYGIHDREET